MSEDARASLHDVWTAEPWDEGRRASPGAVIAAAIAICASVALAWWAATPRRTPPPPPTAPAVSAPAAAAPPLRFASDEPDPSQVKQAYSDVQTAFTQGGAQALVAGSVTCAKAVPMDPRRLDYCLAFDTYAREVVTGSPDAAAEADWFSGAADRDLGLARTVLPPDVDATNRVAQVDALTRAVLPKPKPAPRPEARPARVRHRHHAAKPHRAAHARPAAAVRHKPSKAAARRPHAHDPAPPRDRPEAAEPLPPGPWDEEVPPH